MAEKKNKKKKADTTKSEADTEANANRGVELAQQALDPEKQEDVEAAIKELTPEQAEAFVKMLERSLKKQRLQLLGYISALVALIIGTVFSLYVYGSREPGTFVGWVFFVPFICAASLLLLFGRLARRSD